MTSYAIRSRAVMILLGALALMTFPFSTLRANPGVEYILYTGYLTDQHGAPVTTTVTLRFSLWSSDLMEDGDVTGTGAINIGSTNYAGWKEAYEVTPNESGYFSVRIGAPPQSFPDFSAISPSILSHLSWQIDVKPQGNPSSSYETLDSLGGTAVINRFPLRSAAFAINADFLGQRKIGTGSGTIPLLGSGGLLLKSMVPAGTAKPNFMIDSDGVAQDSILLQFGSLLGKKLSYDIPSARFSFNDDVHIEGNISVTGTINNVDLSNRDISAVLSPPFAGVSFQAHDSQNVGRLFLQTATGAVAPSYLWTSTKTTLQSYDVVLSVRLPDDFQHWQVSPLTVSYRTQTNDASENAVSISIFDTSGQQVELSPSSDNLADASWTQTVISFGGSPVWTPGDNFVIRIRLSSKEDLEASLGAIGLHYVKSPL